MTRSNQAAAIVAAAIFSFCLATLGQAAVPSSLNYQGYLTDASGAAVEGSTEMMFTIYSDATSGAPLWSSGFLVVPVDQGLFSIQLGGVANPFSANLFNTPLWLGVTIRGEAEMEPRRPLTTVGFAFQADDALTLTGQTAAALDQSAHVVDTANPHSVTAAQSGAATPADIADLQSQLNAAASALETAVAALQADLVTVQTALAVETQARIDADNAEAATRSTVDAHHDTAITDIQNNTVMALDGFLTRSGNTALFTGLNVQIVNGTGTTEDVVNGLGNLIVGYDETRTGFGWLPYCSLGVYDNEADCVLNGGVWAISHKSGSHNIVVGTYHNYSRFGGIVVGWANNITGDRAAVSGGSVNTAGGNGSSICGGRGNTATGNGASVSGGSQNTASSEDSSVSGGANNTASSVRSSISGGGFNTSSSESSSVSGGYNNTASGAYSSVSGGRDNTAAGEGFDFGSSVSGGFGNTASGAYSSVSGGDSNTASGSSASIGGGRNNEASGGWSSVSGGGSENPAFGNHAYANYSSILGGIFNEAGDLDSGDRTIGSISAIAGGDTNQTTGAHSSISGGVNNKATGFRASVSGGESNDAFGAASSVSGGKSNVASGALTSVVGGDDRTCTSDMCGEGVISATDP